MNRVVSQLHKVFGVVSGLLTPQSFCYAGDNNRKLRTQMGFLGLNCNTK